MKVKKAPTIVFCGPDGVGKSTVIKLLSISLKDGYSDVVIRNWRPGLLPRLGSLLGKPPETVLTNDGLILPRRKAGKMQLLRVIYYLLDFWLGFIFKDRADTIAGRVVLYDRGNLDTLIDPVRYGLKENSFLKFFINCVPKPGTSILYYDDPENIFSRKPELTVAEIKTQLQKWLIFVNRGLVDAVIKIDSEPNVIARRTQDFIESTIKRNQNDSYTPQEQLTWLNLALSAKDQPLLLFNSKFSKNNKFAFLNFQDGRGYIFPIDNHESIKTGLDVYQPQQFTSRMFKKFSPVLSKIFFNSRFSNVVYLNDSGFGSSLIYGVINSLGKPGIKWAISIGAPGPFRKPVVKLFSSNPQFEAYLKVGFNTNTKLAVKNEIEALNFLNKEKFGYLLVPKVIVSGEWQDKLYCLQTSKMAGVGESLKEFSEIHYNVLDELTALNFTRKNSQDITFIHQLSYKIEEIENSYYNSLGKLGIEWLLSKNNKIPINFSHGDFTPWNMLKVGDKLYLYDWEFSVNELPAGWDIIRYIIQIERYVNKLSIRDATYKVFYKISNNSFIMTFLNKYQITTDDVKFTLVAYLLNELRLYGTNENLDYSMIFDIGKAINQFIYESEH